MKALLSVMMLILLISACAQKHKDLLTSVHTGDQLQPYHQLTLELCYDNMSSDIIVISKTPLDTLHVKINGISNEVGGMFPYPEGYIYWFYMNPDLVFMPDSVYSYELNTSDKHYSGYIRMPSEPQFDFPQMVLGQDYTFYWTLKNMPTKQYLLLENGFYLQGKYFPLMAEDRSFTICKEQSWASQCMNIDFRVYCIEQNTRSFLAFGDIWKSIFYYDRDNVLIKIPPMRAVHNRHRVAPGI